jgi:hypothetical protein
VTSFENNFDYETIYREVNRRLIYDCRCDEKLKTQVEESTRLGYIGLYGGLEHLKMGTRLIDKSLVSVMGECVILTPQVLFRYSK